MTTGPPVCVSRALNSVALLMRIRATGSSPYHVHLSAMADIRLYPIYENMLCLCLVKSPLQTQSAGVEQELNFIQTKTMINSD